jgi:RNA polymerase sigma-70 factor (ECF subfamily)
MESMRAIEMEEATDEELVARVRAGAFGVFGTLVRRHARRVHRAVRSILREEAEVEDAAQQAFLQAFVAIRGFEGASAFSTWLTRIAVNEALMRARQARRAPLHVVPDPELLPSVASGPEQRASARELVEAVGAAVRRLPPRHRETLQLRCLEGLSVTQAAERLGVSEAAVKIRLSRARRLLRLALEPEAPVPDPRPGTVTRPGERAFTGDARG